MFHDPRPIDNKADTKIRITPPGNYAFCADQTSALLGLSEVMPCSKEFPVLFARLDTGMAPVALLGLPEQGNCAVVEDQWQFRYIPAVFRTYPFLLAQTDDNGEQFAVCLERTAPHLSEENGEPLFTEEGKPAPLMERAKVMLQNLHAEQSRGLAWGKVLEEKQLLVPFALAVTQDNQRKTLPLEGLFFIDENRLNALSDEDFCDLRAKGVLPIAYAHLLSLGNVERIVLQNTKQVTP